MLKSSLAGVPKRMGVVIPSGKAQDVREIRLLGRLRVFKVTNYTEKTESQKDQTDIVCSESPNIFQIFISDNFFNFFYTFFGVFLLFFHRIF